jgi:predicted TIM-barrel fold metal-dependent hydrolase
MARNGIAVIDAHHHVGSVHAVERETGRPAADEGTKEYRELELSSRVQTMDELGVDQSIVIPGHGYLRPNGHEDTKRTNNAIAAYRDRTPGRFPAAIGIVEPLHGAKSLDELGRIKEELGLVGVSFHVRFQGVSTNSVYVLTLAREMAQLGLFPYVHATAASLDESLWKVQDFADSIPEVPVLALDSFSSSEQAREAVRVAQQTPNLYFDTSVCMGLHLILPVLDEVGPERLVFGTDQYSSLGPLRPNSRRNIIDALMATDLVDEEAKRLIFGGNIRRLLGLN